MAEPHESRLTVTVNHAPPTRTPDGCLRFTYWAIAQEGRSRREGQAIEFLINHVLDWEANSLHDGRTASREYVSASGVAEVLLEAQAKDNAAIRSQKNIRLEVRTAQAASIKHFKMKNTEREGEVLIVLRVLDKEGRPVQGAIVNLLDKSDPRFVYLVGSPTDRTGMIRFSIPAEPVRDVTALIQGIEERIRTTYA